MIGPAGTRQITLLRFVIVVALTCAIAGLIPTATARGRCSSSAHAVGDVFAVAYHCVRPSEDANGGHGDRNSSGHSSSSAAYHPIRLAASECRGLSSFAVCGGTQALCTMSATVSNGQIFGGGRAPTGCTPAQATAAAAGPAPLPQVTPGLVLTALRRIGLPSATARTQPKDKTLVNFATIFYARPEAVTRTLTLLGRQVQVEASPRSFVWHYGDGATSTTASPGAPYPAKDITHEYTDAHVTVQTSVDVSYSGRFRVGGGAWQDIPGIVTIAGPSAPLRISEASGVLSGNYG
jgi:hypothetical protein